MSVSALWVVGVVAFLVLAAPSYLFVLSFADECHAACGEVGYDEVSGINVLEGTCSCTMLTPNENLEEPVLEVEVR